MLDSLNFQYMLNNFFNAYKEFWIKATEFKGFTSRSDWWLVQLANLIISLLTIPIFLKTFGFNAYGLVCVIPQIAIDIRRIRDFGKDWKWIFINLIPIFGWILWFIWLGLGKTGNGKNKIIQKLTPHFFLFLKSTNLTLFLDSICFSRILNTCISHSINLRN